MKKDERLHHRSLVEGLYRKGRSFYEYPLRVTWRKLSPDEMRANFRNNPPEGIGAVQMMVTVPKKKRKRAVDRVLMRRRIRESYRLNRESLLRIVEHKDSIRTFSIGFVYQHPDNMSYHELDEKMKAAIGKLCKLVDKDN